MLASAYDIAPFKTQTLDFPVPVAPTIVIKGFEGFTVDMRAFVKLNDDEL